MRRPTRPAVARPPRIMSRTQLPQQDQGAKKQTPVEKNQLIDLIDTIQNTTSRPFHFALALYEGGKTVQSLLVFSDPASNDGQNGFQLGQLTSTGEFSWLPKPLVAEATKLPNDKYRVGIGVSAPSIGPAPALRIVGGADFQFSEGKLSTTPYASIQTGKMGHRARLEATPDGLQIHFQSPILAGNAIAPANKVLTIKWSELENMDTNGHWQRACEHWQKAMAPN